MATREQTETDYDVIVVGAGPGGSALAALLAKAGLRVLLVDKNRVAGGRMMTVHRDGFFFELFPINCVPATDSLFEKLIQDLGLEDQVQVIFPELVGRFYFELPGGEIRTMDMMANKESLNGLRRLLGLRLWDLLKLVRFFRDMLAMQAERLQDLAGISALGFLGRYDLPQSLFSYLLCVYAEGIFELPADRISGQYGDGRLNGESPISGLYYVGCDAGGFGLGTHQALDSAVNVSRLVLAYHRALGRD